MKTILERFLSEKTRLEENFENQDLDILIRVDAGLELSQLWKQDKQNASLWVRKARDLIWEEAVR